MSMTFKERVRSENKAEAAINELFAKHKEDTGVCLKLIFGFHKKREIVVFETESQHECWPTRKFKNTFGSCVEAEEYFEKALASKAPNENIEHNKKVYVNFVTEKHEIHMPSKDWIPVLFSVMDMSKPDDNKKKALLFVLEATFEGEPVSEWPLAAFVSETNPYENGKLVQTVMTKFSLEY